MWFVLFERLSEGDGTIWFSDANGPHGYADFTTARRVAVLRQGPGLELIYFVCHERFLHWYRLGHDDRGIATYLVTATRLEAS